MESMPHVTKPPSLAGAGVFPRATAESGNVPSIAGITSLSRPWGTIFAVIIIFICLLGTFVIYFLLVTTSSKIRHTNSRIEEHTKQLASEPLVSTEAQVKAIAGAISGYKLALNQRLDYASFNEEIARITPQNVTLTTLALDEKGGVRISATAPDFPVAGKALLAYRSSRFLDNIKLESISLAQKDNLRVVELTLVGTVKKNQLSLTSTKAVNPAASNVTAP